MSQGNRCTILYIPTICYKHQTERGNGNYLIKHIITSDRCRNCCWCFCTLKRDTDTFIPTEGNYGLEQHSTEQAASSGNYLWLVFVCVRPSSQLGHWLYCPIFVLWFFLVPPSEFQHTSKHNYTVLHHVVLLLQCNL